MVEITKKDINNILIKVVSKTYLIELITKTPGNGKVANEWDIRLDKDGVVIYNDEFGDIVLFLEEGTKPHKIKPKHRDALAFEWRNAPFDANGKNGKYLFKEVNHPGIAARHFVRDIINDKKLHKKFSELLDKELEKLFKKLTH
jgi:hypothetical protein